MGETVDVLVVGKVIPLFSSYLSECTTQLATLAQENVREVYQR
jgi:hypothetical protein